MNAGPFHACFFPGPLGRLGDLQAFASGFVPAVTSGDFVFIAGQMARGADGNPDPRAHVPLLGWIRDPASD